MINIGTLSAFFLVSLAVPVLRGGPTSSAHSWCRSAHSLLASAAICASSHADPAGGDVAAFPHLASVLGFVIYFLYGYKHSRLAGRSIEDSGVPSLTSTESRAVPPTAAESSVRPTSSVARRAFRRDSARSGTSVDASQVTLAVDPASRSGTHPTFVSAADELTDAGSGPDQAMLALVFCGGLSSVGGSGTRSRTNRRYRQSPAGRASSRGASSCAMRDSAAVRCRNSPTPVRRRGRLFRASRLTR